jgi:hypothetical protein
MTTRFLLQGFGVVVVVVLCLLSGRDSTLVLVQSTKPTLAAVSNMAPLTAVELLTLDSVALQERLTAGLLTSVDLVKQCLQQIENHDHRGMKLNAVISIVPHQSLMTRSKQLDLERAQGRIRGPLHGIPMLVKVGRSVIIDTNTGLIGCRTQSLPGLASVSLQHWELVPAEQLQGLGQGELAQGCATTLLTCEFDGSLKKWALLFWAKQISMEDHRLCFRIWTRLTN